MPSTTTPAKVSAQPAKNPKFSGAPMGASSASAPPPPPKTSGKAITALVLAIIGFFIVGIIFGPIAICLAASAKNDIRERPTQVKGEGIANAAMIVGAIALIVSIVIIILYLA